VREISGSPLTRLHAPPPMVLLPRV